MKNWPVLIEAVTLNKISLKIANVIPLVTEIRKDPHKIAGSQTTHSSRQGTRPDRNGDSGSDEHDDVKQHRTEDENVIGRAIEQSGLQAGQVERGCGLAVALIMHFDSSSETGQNPSDMRSGDLQMRFGAVMQGCRRFLPVLLCLAGVSNLAAEDEVPNELNSPVAEPRILLPDSSDKPSVRSISTRSIETSDPLVKLVLKHGKPSGDVCFQRQFTLPGKSCTECLHCGRIF